MTVNDMTHYMQATSRLRSAVHDAEIDIACVAQELHDWRGDPADRCEAAANDLASVCERLRAVLDGAAYSPTDQSRGSDGAV